MYIYCFSCKSTDCSDICREALTHTTQIENAGNGDETFLGQFLHESITIEFADDLIVVVRFSFPFECIFLLFFLSLAVFFSIFLFLFPSFSFF